MEKDLPKEKIETGISSIGFENLKEALNKLSAHQLDEIALSIEKIQKQKLANVEWEHPEVSTEKIFREWFKTRAPSHENMEDEKTSTLRKQLLERDIKLVIKCERVQGSDYLMGYIVDSKGNEFRLLNRRLMSEWVARLQSNPTLSHGQGLLDELVTGREISGQKWVSI